MKRILNRSVLFTPADRLKAMTKALGIGQIQSNVTAQFTRPDVVILDLEDSVSPYKKKGKTLLCMDRINDCLLSYL